MSKFEIGKKYKNDYLREEVYTCLFIPPSGHPLMQRSDGTEFILSAHAFSHFKEYKEPQKIKFYVPIFRVDGKLQRGFYTYNHKDVAIANAIDWVEIEYTEKE